MVISIRAQRVNRDLTQKEVSEQMGMSEAKYSRIEGDPSRMRLREIFRLSEILDVSPAQLFAAADSSQTKGEDAA
jgi:transcriptional regulator with XRE-family HTH domain